MQEDVLRIKDLQVTLAKKKSELDLVSCVSFSLKRAKTLALVGESGSGKTTCALAILQLLPKYLGYRISGTIAFANQNILHMSYPDLSRIRGKGIGIIFQDPSSSLNPVFTIGNQLAEMFQYHENMLLQESRFRSIELFRRVDLECADDCFEIYPHELSGGMKQRVVIAIALALRPKILIADEPTTALDVTIQREILLLLKELQQEFSMAQLLITHDMGVVREMADDVAVMYAGQIVEFRKKDDVLSNPLHPYTKALLASRPRKEMHKKPLTIIPGSSPNPAERPGGCPFHPRCPYRMPKCISGPVPDFAAGGDSSQIVRCWLYESPQASKNEGKEV
jgi:oligopeptide/dipeptide ABC transporter ATP-binding protein